MAKSKKIRKRRNKELKKTIEEINLLIKNGDYIEAKKKADFILEEAKNNNFEKLAAQTTQILERIRFLIAKQYNTEQLSKLGSIEHDTDFNKRLLALNSLLKHARSFEFSELIKRINHEIDICKARINQEIRETQNRKKEALRRKFEEINPLIQSGDFQEARRKVESIIEEARVNNFNTLVNQSQKMLEDIRFLISKRYITDQLQSLGPIEEDTDLEQSREKLESLLNHAKSFDFDDLIKEIEDQLEFCENKKQQEILKEKEEKRIELEQEMAKVDSIIQNENYLQAKKTLNLIRNEAESYHLDELINKTNQKLDNIQTTITKKKVAEDLSKELLEIESLIEEEEYKEAKKALKNAIKKAEEHNLVNLNEKATQMLDRVKELKKRVRDEKFKKMGTKVKGTFTKVARAPKGYLNKRKEKTGEKLPLKRYLKAITIFQNDGALMTFVAGLVFTFLGLFLFVVGLLRGLPEFAIGFLILSIIGWIISAIMIPFGIILPIKNLKKNFNEELEKIEKLESKLERVREEVKKYIEKAANVENIGELDSIYSEIESKSNNILRDVSYYATLNKIENFLHPRNWTFYSVLKSKINQLENYFSDIDQSIESINLYKKQILQNVANLLKRNIPPGASISSNLLLELIGFDMNTTFEIIEELKKERMLPGTYVKKEDRFIRSYDPPIAYSNLTPPLDRQELLDILREKVDYLPIGDVIFFFQMKDRLDLEKFLSKNGIHDIKLTREHVVILENPITEVSE